MSTDITRHACNSRPRELGRSHHKFSSSFICIILFSSLRQIIAPTDLRGSRVMPLNLTRLLRLRLPVLCLCSNGICIHSGQVMCICMYSHIADLNNKQLYLHGYRIFVQDYSLQSLEEKIIERNTITRPA